MQLKMEAPTARINESEERFNDIEDKIIENRENEEKRDKQVLDQQGRVREISDATKQNSIRNTGIPEEPERERGKRYIGENYSREPSIMWRKNEVSKFKSHRESPQNQ